MPIKIERQRSAGTLMVGEEEALSDQRSLYSTGRERNDLFDSLPILWFDPKLPSRDTTSRDEWNRIQWYSNPINKILKRRNVSCDARIDVAYLSYSQTNKQSKQSTNFYASTVHNTLYLFSCFNPLHSYVAILHFIIILYIYISKYMYSIHSRNFCYLDW